MVARSVVAPAKYVQSMEVEATGMAAHLNRPDSDASCQQQGESGEHEGRHAQNDRCESWNRPVKLLQCGTGHKKG